MYGPSTTHKDDHFAKKTTALLKFDNDKLKNFF